MSGTKLKTWELGKNKIFRHHQLWNKIEAMDMNN